VAINLLFSFIDDRFEKAIEAIIPNGIFISRSSKVLPEYREYERGITTWLNAWVGPLVKAYLQRLSDGLPNANITVMQSAGGTIDVSLAGDAAVNMLLSGPAGGLAGARYTAAASGQQKLLSFDMGDTPTDVAMLNSRPDEELTLTNNGKIGRYPVAVPMVDMYTIGAGGVELVTILIKQTTTKTGLKVFAQISKKVYETGRKVAEDFYERANIEFDKRLGQFNYVINPTT